MADSTLDLNDSLPQASRKGQGTRELGPSDTSDSGSDLQGPGRYDDDTGFELDTGTNSDIQRGAGAGRDVGDANLDSDSDASGTGERATAGRDVDVESGSDIAPDRITGSEAQLAADALDRIAMEDAIDSDEEDQEEKDSR